MIDFNRPAIVGNELKYIQDAVAQGMLCGDGKYTKLCSEWMRKRFDVNQVFLTTSCTHALEMAAFLSDIQPGDEVIMPSYTFVSTADAFVLRGARIVFTDIRPDAVKTGMVSSSELIEVIADKLTEYKAKNIVIDPVMVATSGARLISEDAISTLKTKLLPLATVITPNIPEAEVLCGMEIKTEADMEKAAEAICNSLGCAVLLKGGHQLNDANDLLYEKGCAPVWFHGKRIDNPNTHGTGCTLSSAIASNLAKGRDLKTSVEKAKAYISGALAAMLDLGKGSGPMNHAFAIKGEYEIQ